MLRDRFSGLRSRLGIQFLVYTVPLVGLIGFGTLFVTGYLNHKTQMRALETRGKVITALQAGALSRPLWNLDDRMVSSVMESLANDPDYVAGNVFDDAGQLVYGKGNEDKTSQATREFSLPITVVVDGSSRAIGNLDVAFSQDSIIRAIRNQAGIGLFGFLILMLLLTTVLFLVLRRQVLVPLNALVDAIQHVERKDWRTVAWRGDNEIGRVIGAFNRMVENLRAAEETEQLLREERERAAEGERFAQTLMASEERLRSILDALPYPVLITQGSSARIAFANDMAASLFGRRKGDLTRRPLADLWADPSDILHQIGRTTGSNAVNHAEHNLETTSGHSFWALTTATAMEYGDEASVLCVLHDITQRKVVEEQLLKAKDEAEASLAQLHATQTSLIEAEKMASLGSLVAGVAHEINTPVGIIVSAVSFLRENADEISGAFNDGKVRKRSLERFIDTTRDAARLIEVNATRAANLVQSFKQVAVDRTSDPRRVFQLHEYISEVIMSLRPRIKSRHEVEIDCPDHIEVDSYPGALAQVLTNFVLNAVSHAFPAGETGRVEITVTEPTPDMVELTVRDDGKGIDKDNLRRIFEPFFTTARNTGGTGLGLHIVYNIIRGKLDGDITVESEVGKGTAFIVAFPKVASRTDQDQHEPETTGAIPGPSENFDETSADTKEDTGSRAFG